MLQASGLSKRGAQVVNFDWDNPSTWAAGLNGVKSVFLVRPMQAKFANLVEAFIQVCKNARVKHLVRLSILDAPRPGQPNPGNLSMMAEHGKCDQMV